MRETTIKCCAKCMMVDIFLKEYLASKYMWLLVIVAIVVFCNVCLAKFRATSKKMFSFYFIF